MRNIIIYLISMLFLTACQEHDQKKIAIKNNQTSYLEYPERVSKKNIKTLIDHLESVNCMHSEFIGIEGRKSDIFAVYKRLDQLASDSLWLQLSYSPNPVVRVYSYKALRSRNAALASKVKDRLKNDTAKLCWITHDMDLSCTINFYISNTE